MGISDLLLFVLIGMRMRKDHSWFLSLQILKFWAYWTTVLVENTLKIWNSNALHVTQQEIYICSAWFSFQHDVRLFKTCIYFFIDLLVCIIVIWIETRAAAPNFFFFFLIFKIMVLLPKPSCRGWSSACRLPASAAQSRGIVGRCYCAWL